MKEFIKNKFLIILFLFVILISSIISTCFAENKDVLHFNTFDKDFNFTLPSGYGVDYNYYFILSKLTNNQYGTFYSFFIFLCNSEIVYDIDVGRVYFNSNGGKEYIYYKGFTYENKVDSNLDFSNYSISDFDKMNCDFQSSAFYSDGYCDYCSANHNIKNSSGEVVFQVAPVTVEQVTIPAIQQVGEIPQAMKEILKILIPVGLVIFGTGLLSFLIRYLSSRLM